MKSLFKTLICSVCLAASSVVLTNLLWPSHYETTDDLTYSMLLSGVGLTSAPTDRIWFTNITLAHALMSFYQAFPHVRWYAIYLFAVLIAALAMIATAFMLRFKRKIGAAMFAVFYFIAGVFTVNSLQYTSAAVLLAQAGFLLVFSGSAQKNFRVGFLTIATLAMLFSSLMRFESFLLVLAFSTATLLITTVANKNFPDSKKQIFGWLALSIVACFTFKALSDHNYESRKEWQGHRLFMARFIQIADSNVEEKEQRSDGLSANDFTLVQNFFVADKNVFSTSNLELSLKNAVMPVNIDDIVLVIENNILPIVAFSVITGALLDSRLMSWRRFLIWLLFVSTVIMYLAFFMKLPPRAYFSILNCVSSTVLVLLDRRKLRIYLLAIRHLSRTKKLLLSTGAFMVALSIMVFLDFQLSQASAQAVQKNIALKKAITTLKPDSKQLYIILGWDAPYKFMLPWDDLSLYFKDFEIYRTSGWSRTPIGEEMLKRHGVNNVLDATGSSNVFLISDPVTNSLFAKFCQEHYGKKVSFNSVFDRNEIGLHIYRLISP